MKVNVYLGGGSGTLQIDIPNGVALADVNSSISTKTNVDTAIAQSNPVPVAAGQTVIVTANAAITNNSGAPASTAAVIAIVSGPSTTAAGPDIGTPTVAIGDGWPLTLTAAFAGLPPGTYVFGLFIHQGKTNPWGVADWEVVTQIVG